MTTTRILAAVLVLASAATAAADPGQLVGVVNDSHTKLPLDGVSVTVMSPTGHRSEVLTDEHGLYHVALPEHGAYTVTFQLGENASKHMIAYDGKAVTMLDAALEGPSETIEITEHVAPPVLPKAKFNSKKLPPYTDQLVMRDKWVKQWVLLELDENGRVTRLKFLHKMPGYDLAPIAAKFAFDMQFSPARDGHGKIMRTQVAWPLEWPSYWWLLAYGYQPTALPVAYGPELSNKPYDPMRLDPEQVLNDNPMNHVPCEGSGPLNLTSVHAVYRDCTEPDLDTADQQPWIDRAWLAAQTKH
ncbi:MAG TPA: carboxypeptidase-like regulatory domain-containing protein [Kofleriaceae bacterium]|jgi:hypothetical protein